MMIAVYALFKFYYDKRQQGTKCTTAEGSTAQSHLTALA